MTWASPQFAWLFALAIPAALLLRHASRQRRRVREALTDAPTGTPRRWAEAAAVAALALVVVALCRPQWKEAEEQNQLRGIDIVVALDVSRSMLADDATPTRLAAAKSALAELARALGGDRIALVAFAGSAFTVCPLTHDYSLFEAALRDADPESFPLGGTRLATGLGEALRSFGDDPQRARMLVVVSDGEDHGDYDAELVESLRRARISVHGAVVGTRAGALIRRADGEFVRDRRGVPVASRASSDSLQHLASATGGTVFDLGADPHALVRLPEAARASAGAVTMVVRRLPLERFQWPLAVALLLLLVEPLLRPGSQR